MKTRADRAQYGQTLTRHTALMLLIEKLREAEELARTMAQLSSDARWLTISELYGRQAREKLPRLARANLNS